ncbi:MAG TPA: FHA domain-containing serine/threonine-protein kinase [Anaerolineae bacterium]|nr:FHA domain-containing serine/threonine-protein kinase [Anaerolineae bacterium]
MKDLTGKTWGRFQIIEERGRGGMAVVYKAYDCVLQRTVALKVLLPTLAADEAFTHRFRQEAITAANLRHPNIVVIFDVGAHERFQFIVMEYLEGPTLQQELQKSGSAAGKGALPVWRVIRMVEQLASALDYAHGQRLVHRDVKPANIMIGQGDHVTLTDFGLVKAVRGAKVTGEGAAVGTLKYMSPEQAAGKELDSRSDIYALGVVVYEMLSGEAPFTGTTPYQTLQALMHQPPPPLSRVAPSISPAIEQVVLRALAKEPHRRFPTATSFVQALSQASGTSTGTSAEFDTEQLRHRTWLLLVAPDGRRFSVGEGETAIGRDTVNDVVVPSPKVSRQHARIHLERTGASVPDAPRVICTVTDLRSTNGTFVNGVPLAPGEATNVKEGDLLGIGPVTLLVTLPVGSGAPGSAGRVPGATESIDIIPGKQ